MLGSKIDPRVDVLRVQLQFLDLSDDNNENSSPANSFYYAVVVLNMNDKVYIFVCGSYLWYTK